MSALSRIFETLQSSGVLVDEFAGSNSRWAIRDALNEMLGEEGIYGKIIKTMSLETNDGSELTWVAFGMYLRLLLAGSRQKHRKRPCLL